MADGGIMEAALLSAAIGGGTSLATGQDPLKGALLGAVTGGAGAGIGSLLPGATAIPGAAAEATNLGNQATSILGNAIGGPGTGGLSLSTLGQSSLNPSLANFDLSGVAQGVGQGVTQGATQGIENAGIVGLNGERAANLGQVIPNTVPDVSSAFTPATLGTTPDEMRAIQQSGLAQGAQQGVQQGVQNANPLTNGIRNLAGISPDSNGYLAKGLNYYDKQDTLTKGLLGAGTGYGYGMLTKGPNTVPELEKYKSKLAGYNRDLFTPDIAQPEMPYYKASYAEGGIANLQGPMYPQSQQVQTQYATPSQRPISSEVVNSDYEAQTNPYTGEPVRGFAAGGSMDVHGSIDLNDSSTGGGGGSSISLPPLGSGGNQNNSMNMMQGGSDIYHSNGGASGQQQPIGGGMAAKGGSSSGGAFGSDGPIEATVQGVQNQQPQYRNQLPQQYNNPFMFAQGGPIAYAQGGGVGSLGGYAHGGNPQLLDGPGDGMSDSIPASIGNKQPARLAQGEFVVPADVVSHLGNGSTDAGAKHLYSMMDNIRKARTGNKHQGKQINANQFLPR